jgi:hypothetical protein
MQRARFLALTLVAAFAVLAASAAAKGRLPAHSLFKVKSVDKVDVGPEGDSLGDMTILAFRVFDARSGRRIGAGHGYCVRTEVGRASTCLSNSSLPGGRIVLQWEEHDGETGFRAAIIGGTGRYRDQRGELRFSMG